MGPSMRFALAVLALFAMAAAAAASQTHAFEMALIYQGECTGTPDSYVCDLRAGSQALTTLVKSNGEVDFMDKHMLGSVSVMTLKGGINAQGKLHESGNFTLGVSQNHHEHVVRFTGEGLVGGHLSDSLACFSSRFNVTGSFGQGFANARGSMASTGCNVKNGDKSQARVAVSATILYDGHEQIMPEHPLLSKHLK